MNRHLPRKLFSLPKLLLFPGILVANPWLGITVLPVSAALDLLKSSGIAMLTRWIEKLADEGRVARSRRDKVEAHDSKNEALIGHVYQAGAFTRAHWARLTRRVQAIELETTALATLRSFVNWLYWSNLLMTGIECLLAQLMASNTIAPVDIWVYSRVVEDSLDFVLTKSKNEAQIATVVTQLDRLDALASSITKARNQTATGTALTCEVDAGGGGGVRLFDVSFRRGRARASFGKELVLEPGRVYAVTGANGCGKSTTFALLHACSGAEPLGRPKLHESIEILSAAATSTPSIVLPSRDVVEISQRFYCPLHSTPIAWISQPYEDKRKPSNETILALLDELEFFPRRPVDETNSTAVTTTDTATTDSSFLYLEREHWYGELSGGQQSKIEFMRNVFLREKCPAILLIDEAFAPLDPTSKRLVQGKIKASCRDSVILVIYHADAAGGSGDDGVGNGGDVGAGADKRECIDSQAAFFDKELHFDKGGEVVLRRPCG